MTAPTVNVTCTAHDQNGNPVAGALFVARLDRTEIYDGFVVPEQFTGVANADGVCVLQLWPNALGVASSQYKISAVNPDDGRRFLNSLATIPNNDCFLHEVMTLEPYPPINAAQQALVAAQNALAPVQEAAAEALGYRDDALNSMNTAVAAASAASASADSAAASELAAQAAADAIDGFIADVAAPTGAALVGFQQPGGVARTAESKLRESVSVKDFGASPSATPAANYTATQAALNSGSRRVVVPADGDYTINAELIVPAGVILEGQTGARIIQDTYGLSGVQLRNDGSAVKSLTIENLKTKTQLSTTVPNRYDGDVQRTRASGVYVAASNCTVEDVACPGFINGVNLVGGERVWTTTSGTLTATTLQLNATSQQANDYYNGWTLRIFSTVTATDYVNVTDYDSATNTVTFPTVSTFTGPYYYILIGGKHTGNTVKGYKGDRNDFGILAQYQDALTIDDIDQLSIEQTQEINARPHTVYVTDQVTNLRGSRWRTNNCPEGHAYKFRAVADAVLTDLSARNSRAVLAIEESSKFYVDGCIGTDIGTATFRPESANVTSSDDVHIENIKLRIAPGFDSGGSAELRPVALVIGDDAFLPVTNSTFRGIDSECRGADQAFAVFIPAPIGGTHSGLIVDDVTTRGGGTWSGGSTTPVLVRAFAVDNLGVQGLRHIGAGTPTAIFETTATNSTLAYESRRANPTVTNSGTANKVLVDGEERAVFTPVIVGTTAAGAGTYTAQVGRYSKVGRLVHFQLHVAWTAHTGTGNMRISGLPFTSIAVANSLAAISVGQVSEVSLTAGSLLNGVVNTNSTQIILYQTPTGGGASGFVAMDGAGTLTIAGHYEATT